MLRGYVLHSRRSAASGQEKALREAGVAAIYVEGKNEQTFDAAFRSLRPGDGLTVVRLSDLANDRRELRRRIKAIHDRGCYVHEQATGRDSREPDKLSEMIFEATDILAQVKKGHDPKKAREFGSRGGRPRMDRGITDADAEKHWFDMRHATNTDALKHMGEWTESAAWRKFGASGRKTGPRRPLPAKRKRRS